MNACLAGVRVVELGQALSGAYAGQILADLGAEVVRAEPPEGDPWAQAGVVDNDGVSAAYKAINAGKTCVALDLRAESDRARLSELLLRADVLIDSQKPGAMERLGFDRRRLGVLNAGLIHVSITPWGRSGPYANRDATDLAVMALGGGLVMSGSSVGPVPAHPPTSDHAAGMQASTSVMAALFRRERSRRAVGGMRDGRGAFIEISQVETVLAWQAAALNEAWRGHPPERRQDLLTGGSAGYQVYRTRDSRHLAVGAVDRTAWIAFCNGIARPEWISRQREPLPQRHLIDDVSAVIRQRTLADWYAVFQEVDCNAEPVWFLDEVPHHPHLRGRGSVRAGGDRYDGLQVRSPMMFDDHEPADRAPLVRAPVDSVLSSWSVPERPAARADEAGAARGQETRGGEAADAPQAPLVFRSRAGRSAGT